MWKETFEKAKKIVGFECEIYAGKIDLTQGDINNEANSNINFNESINCKDQTKLIDQSEEYDTTLQNTEIEKRMIMLEEKKQIRNEENILTKIINLKIKDESEKK